MLSNSILYKIELPQYYNTKNVTENVVNTRLPLYTSNHLR